MRVFTRAFPADALEHFGETAVGRPKVSRIAAIEVIKQRVWLEPNLQPGDDEGTECVVKISGSRRL